MYQDIADSLFSVMNFFDELIIVDQDGIIQYCKIFEPNVYSFTADEIIGKHVFEIFPSSSMENSEIFQVIKTGQPLLSIDENFITYRGDRIEGYSSIYPIYKSNQIIGAVTCLKFKGVEFHKERFEVYDHGCAKTISNDHYTFDHLITVDPVMLEVKSKIKKLAFYSSAVLIQGDTGTGKEIVAHAIHYSGNRVSKPFISQNCAAIPSNLLESTLFGTEKGSYTGAITRKGLVELADEGTLFLDEINSMDINLQSKLLKVVEDKSFRRIGGHQNIDIDVRIIAAINEDPFVAIKENRLRPDLFYRLNVVGIKIPNLSERKADILHIGNYYIDEYNKSFNKRIKGFAADTEEVFKGYSWPGNVRELKNVIEGVFCFSEGPYIEIKDLPSYILDGVAENQEGEEAKADVDYGARINMFKKQLLVDALNTFKSKTKAAKSLGLTRQAFNYQLDQFNLK